MMETENGLLVRAEIAGVILERSVGYYVLLFTPGTDKPVVLKHHDVKQLAHALSCAYTPYGEK